ncbi:relaxase/mobilization nuclease domain-containing protein [Bacteroides fragilis]|uniref:relaxase/mobilization nuclease domain-containing protein n=1 Tax=Bacteroides fragilis TaxID=817 RepID=UPI00202FE277|nr:relaxase/mobilization nuclease domain-containing protein [Bacteroides fragilis]MCM0237663.1 relaxase/mobilization nuclease domain-containing protein [Bacteroides fragilis]
MIGKIKKGSGFKGCVNYVLGKEQAALLHAEGVLAESKQDIIRSFCMQTEMNPGLKKSVGHIALSYSAVDAPKLTDEKMIQLAQEYMCEMKITDTQYIIVRHQDREHPHVHIVFNRINNNGKTISDKNDMYRNEQVCKKLKAKHGLYFAKGKEQVKQYRLREPDKSKYEIYMAVKNEIGKSKNWQQLQRQLEEKGIGIHFKYKGQTDEVQGISFSKGEYTFKGSEIDRSFSFSKLDKYFGDAGLTTIENNNQAVAAPTQESVSAPNKVDNPFITGLGGLFSGLSAPADEIPDDSFLRKKKKKKKKQLKL